MLPNTLRPSIAAWPTGVVHTPDPCRNPRPARPRLQVYGVQQLGKYKGNETLFENKALTTVKPKTTETELDYNSTLARVFAGMEDEPAPGAKGSKGKQPAGALPGDIPLAGEAWCGLERRAASAPMTVSLLTVLVCLSPASPPSHPIPQVPPACLATSASRWTT